MHNEKRILTLSNDEEFIRIFNEGSGIKNDPYFIRYYEQLKLLAVKVNSGYNFSNNYFTLMESISLEEKDVDGNIIQWIPIGCTEYAFSGDFDGNNNTISNLYINTNNSHQGLFGLTSGAVIKNIKLNSDNFYSGGHSGTLVGMISKSNIDNCLIISKMKSDKEYIGGVIGYSYNSTIENCIFEGSLINSDNNAGGIAGYLLNSNISSCTNNASIKGKDSIGGIAGTASMTNKPELKSCRNLGSVKGNSKIGGLIGEVLNDRADTVNVTVKESYNAGNVEAESIAGGIIGSVNGNLSTLYCYNTTSVNATAGGMVGGIIGKFNNLNVSAIASVYMCYNAGVITAKGGFIGGIIGYNNSTVLKCFLLGNGVLGIGTGSPKTDGARITTSDRLKTLIGEIKEPFIPDVDGINSGYPIINSIDYIKKTESVNSLEEAVGIMTRYLMEGESNPDIPDLLVAAVLYMNEFGALKNISKFGNYKDRYDESIIAWVNYWNYKIDEGLHSNKTKIPVDVVKAMIGAESGYGDDDWKIRSLNSPKDVMQTLVPGDPEVWMVLNVDPNTITCPEIAKDKGVILMYVQGADNSFTAEKYTGTFNSKECEKFWGVAGGLEIIKKSNLLNMVGYGEKSVIHSYTIDVDGDATRVEKTINDPYYNYEKVTSEMSISIGIGQLSYKINGLSGGNLDQGVKNYNGNPKIKYLHEVATQLKTMGSPEFANFKSYYIGN